LTSAALQLDERADPFHVIKHNFNRKSKALRDGLAAMFAHLGDRAEAQLDKYDCELFGGRLPGEEEHDYHTAAGMVIAWFGRIPHAAEHFEWDGWRIEVVDLDGPRIDKLLLQRMPDADPGDDDDHD